MQQILTSMGSTRGCRDAFRAIEWADAYSESALESAGRGELLIRGAPAPWCNVSFRIGDIEFRVDLWWPHIPLIGEADGAIKYDDTGNRRSLWEEKLRQEWFEDALGLVVLRFIDREVRFTSGQLFDRWQQRSERGASRLWTPPAELEIFQRPPPGRPGNIVWLRRRDDLGTVKSA
jgi:hypothetical protein